MILPDTIGHENQSQHYQHHRCLCLHLSGRITTPDRYSYHTGAGLDVKVVISLVEGCPDRFRDPVRPWQHSIPYEELLCCEHEPFF